MLRTVRFRFGSSKSNPPLEFEPGPVTVFVGPNNSGKSMVLREIEAFVQSGPQTRRWIIERMSPRLPEADEVRRLIQSRAITRPANERALEGQVQLSKIDPVRGEVPGTSAVPGALASKVAAAAGKQSGFVSWDVFTQFVALFMVRLDGRNRFGLTESKQVSDLKAVPRNHLHALFQDDRARQQMRDVTSDAFGSYFVLDPTHVGQLRIRLSERPPEDSSEEQGWDHRSREFHKQATEIGEFSDGVTAFVGLTAAVLSTDFRVMLVDEPEAFLHPILARKLGGTLANLASGRGGNVLAATHSPDFLMGCVEAGDVDVVRLTYRREVPSARILAASDLREMMRDPLLRSTGVLSALFHEGAVVCEGDSDRAFYQEINYRLIGASTEENKAPSETNGIEAVSESKRSEGADNSIFLHAHGKDPVPKLVKPLREMGIPAAAIVDLDILKMPNKFAELLAAALVPEDSRYSWGGHRGRLDGRLKSKSAKYKTEGGIELLAKSERDSADSLLSDLADYGIFVVPKGELESWLEEWLRALNENPAKDRWVPYVFELMGSDPKHPDYLKPQKGDVWDFMRKVGAWIDDPARRGMPN